MTLIGGADDLVVTASIEWDATGHHRSLTGVEIERLCAYVLEREYQAGQWSIAVRIVGDDEISDIHARYLNDPSVTDIITFPYDDDAKGGDIAISADTASRNAAENGWSLADELEFLVAHGLLHILGWNDTSEQERHAMLDHQLTLLQGWRRGS